MKPKKFHAILPAAVSFTPNNRITGHWNLWRAPEGPQLLVCYPPHWKTCEEWIAAMGGAVFPNRNDPSPIGQMANAHPKSGIIGTDSAWAALKKLAEFHQWPELDPNNEAF